MELKIRNGDYIADGIGGERRADGAEALLERALFRLSVRRGSFPFLPELGSELYRLGHEKPSARAAAAKLYAAAALAEETALTVEDVERELGVKVTPVNQDGFDLCDAIFEYHEGGRSHG